MLYVNLIARNKRIILQELLQFKLISNPVSSSNRVSKYNGFTSVLLIPYFLLRKEVLRKS